MDKNKMLSFSSEVYDRIAQEAGGNYPFATGIYHAPFIKPLLKNIRKTGKKPIRLCEVGPNTTPIIQFLDAPTDIHYIGLEASSNATQYAQQHYKNHPHIQILNVAIGSDDETIEKTAHKSISEADLVYASYVGPSVGLIYLVDYIAKRLSNGAQMLVIDRVYEAGEELNGRIIGYVHFIWHLIKHCVVNRVKFPFWSLLKAITQPVIYNNTHYREGKALWSKHVTGSKHEVENQIIAIGKNYHIEFKMTFIGDVIILIGEKRSEANGTNG
ncbi:MAG: hypothetical protein SFZ02_08290 [bacterium]|nr:hypothetical protein [bacterium]